MHFLDEFFDEFFEILIEELLNDAITDIIFTGFVFEYFEKLNNLNLLF